jgi:hypothetical protein
LWSIVRRDFGKPPAVQCRAVQCNAVQCRVVQRAGQHSTAQHSTAQRPCEVQWNAVECNAVRRSTVRGGAAALARSDGLMGDGRREMPMDGGEWVAGNSPPRLREASRRAAASIPALCSGVQCNVISPAPCRAVEFGAAQRGAVQCNGGQWSAVEGNAVQSSATPAAAAIARSDCSSCDGRRIVSMDGGGWIVVNSPLPLREASGRAAESSPVQCSAVLRGPVLCGGVQRRAMQCSAVKSRAVR